MPPKTKRTALGMMVGGLDLIETLSTETRKEPRAFSINFNHCQD